MRGLQRLAGLEERPRKPLRHKRVFVGGEDLRFQVLARSEGRSGRNRVEEDRFRGVVVEPSKGGHMPLAVRLKRGASERLGVFVTDGG